MSCYLCEELKGYLTVSLLLLPQMTFLARFICLQSHQLSQRLGQCIGMPQSTVGRKKLAKANSVIQKYLIYRSSYKTLLRLRCLKQIFQLLWLRSQFLEAALAFKQLTVKYEWGPRKDVCSLSKIIQNILTHFLAPKSLMGDCEWSKMTYTRTPYFPSTVKQQIYLIPTNKHVS